MKNIPTERLDEIANEVLHLIRLHDIFEFLSSDGGHRPALENRLQEVLQTRPAFETIELAMYLRASFGRSGHSPTWQALLNASVEQGIMRGESVDDIFYGIMPSREHPKRNTGYP